MDAEENSAAVRLLWMQRRTVLFCETIVDAEENSADCETVVDAEENRAVRLLWLQRRTVLLETVVNAEENSAAVRLLWMQRRTVLLLDCCECRGEQC